MKEGKNNVFKGKQAASKVLLLLLECKVHILRYNRRFQRLKSNKQAVGDVFRDETEDEIGLASSRNL